VLRVDYGRISTTVPASTAAQISSISWLVTAMQLGGAIATLQRLRQALKRDQVTEAA
jgi:hypothetical protein